MMNLKIKLLLRALCCSLFCSLFFVGNTLAEDREHRIISLAPHITEVLYAVGAGEQIVGAVSYSDFPHAAKDIQRIGSYDKINYEAVLAAQPTLVIGWNSGNGEESIARLKELGIKVYSHEPRTLEDVAESLAIFGQLTGHAEQGELQSKLFLERLQKLRDQYSDLAPVSIYYQLWNEPQMTVNDEHLISDVIRLCSGKNIFGDAIPLIPKISVESVLRWSPEIIVATGMDGERPVWLDDWYQWTSISAVKNGQLYHIHPDLLHRHSPRILDGAEQLCEALAQTRLLGFQQYLPQVIIQTELGAITVEIDQRNAPVTAANFLKYVDEQRFETASFYRTVRMDNQPESDIKIEVIQGGIGFAESDLRLDSIQHETTEQTGILHKDGTISMARNQPGTASSEFFICIGDQPELDFGGKRNPDGQGFAAFGRVIDGMNVVKKIQEQSDEQQMLKLPIAITEVFRRN